MAGTLSGDINFQGQALTAGSERAHYLKLFTGEVYEAFRNNLVLKSTIMHRTLRNGREAQFIHTGRMTSGYHVPGTSLLDAAEQLANAETTITVDDLLTSQAFFYNLDEILSHYSLRGPVARQIGHALSQRYDRNVGRVLFKASGADSPLDGSNSTTAEPGGFRIELGVTNEYDAQALVDGFFEAKSTLEERNVPVNECTCVLSPRQYNVLVSQVDTNILNREYGNSQGNLNSGEGLVSIGGLKILRSNNIPFLGKYGSENGPAIVNGSVAQGKVNDTWGERNDYGAAADFATACGLIYHREAAACVDTLGPTIETTGRETRTIYQGDLVVGKVAMGVDQVRPTVAGAFTSARS